MIENFEKNKLRFYVVQTLRAIPKLKNYDLIVSHGMQSGIVLSLFRRFVKTKEKHIVFDSGKSIRFVLGSRRKNCVYELRY